ncbi:MAG: glycosyltransferase [Burkholderiales bacterium]|nr:glycosyltransferase [Burkholderiales bacterium]
MATADVTKNTASAAGGSGSQCIGVVVIGRNEGERLKRCLASLEKSAGLIVYVDSGSTDGSVAMAQDRGVEVVALDMRTPFTAARARNAGFDRLRNVAPALQYVQFVDGDCEVHSEWLAVASRFMDQHPEVVVVAGRLREKHPEASVYNMLCDLEWDAPAGESKTCGGIAMMRAVAFAVVKGFNSALICGEEPELCSRLRNQGGKVWRLANDMALHDANMMRVGQWWTRSVRAGYSFAQATFVDASSSSGRGRHESLSALLWAFAIPMICAGAICAFGPYGVLTLFVYPFQFLRITARGKRKFKDNCVRSFFLILGKFPELQGQIKYRTERLMGRKSGLIEHK